MIPAHPLAELFPMLGDADAASLAADIGTNGMHDRIVVLDGQILDGRNRHRAAIIAGVLTGDLPPDGDPLWISHFRRFVPAQDGDPLAWVLSKNLHRRHLSEGQRAMVAAKIANLGNGQRASSSANLQSSPPVTQPQAAELLHVSPRSVASAVAVREHGAPGLAERVESGEVAVSVAAEVAKLSVGDQLRILREQNPRDFSRMVREERAKTQAVKKERRQDREAELGARIVALPTKRYGVILADPEWQFEPYSRESGMDRAADNHYPTSPTELIASRPVADIAAEHCVLLLWATAPMTEQAYAVLRAWGFTPKTNFAGVKDRIGTGYWNRNKHELLLLGTRGNVPAPAMGDQFESVFEFVVGEHSAKPDFAHRLAEAHFPSLPKIELNARIRRAGWDAWGFEAPEEVAAQSAAIAHTMASAEPILRAKFTGDNAAELAAELGRPIGTIRTWTFRLGLTDRARLQNNAAHLGEHLGGKTQ